LALFQVRRRIGLFLGDLKTKFSADYFHSSVVSKTIRGLLEVLLKAIVQGLTLLPARLPRRFPVVQA
jgi:hypothetical protein